VRVRGVIVNYRTPELAVKAADALSRQMLRHPGSRVSVIDNCSPDDSARRIPELLAAVPHRDLIDFLPSPVNGGFGAGNNIGVRHALAQEGDPPDVFYFLNPDAMPDPGVLDTLVSYLEAHPEAGIVGTALRDADGHPMSSGFRFPTVGGEFELGMGTRVASRLLSAFSIVHKPEGTPVEVDWVSGASCAIRREVFRRVGLFDEGFFLYFEETDLCRRAKQAGFQVHHLASVQVAHDEGTATGITVGRRPRYWFESRWRYLRKHHGPAYALGSTLASVSAHALGEAKEQLVRQKKRIPPRFLGDMLVETARAAWTDLR
jgi:hypothetical protein